jgi:hypothetical protein
MAGDPWIRYPATGVYQQWIDPMRLLHTRPAPGSQAPAGSKSESDRRGCPGCLIWCLAVLDTRNLSGVLQAAEYFRADPPGDDLDFSEFSASTTDTDQSLPVVIQSDVHPAYQRIGKPDVKVDAVKLALGKPAFTADIDMRGMLIAKVLHSPHAHARIKLIY